MCGSVLWLTTLSFSLSLFLDLMEYDDAVLCEFRKMEIIHLELPSIFKSLYHDYTIIWDFFPSQKKGIAHLNFPVSIIF